MNNQKGQIFYVTYAHGSRNNFVRLLAHLDGPLHLLDVLKVLEQQQSLLLRKYRMSKNVCLFWWNLYKFVQICKKNVCMYTTLKLFLACCFYKIENIFGAKNSIFYAYWPNIWIFKILESWSTICFLLCISFDTEHWVLTIFHCKIQNFVKARITSQSKKSRSSSTNILTCFLKYYHHCR